MIFHFRLDLFAEKDMKSAFRMDMIISPSKYPDFNPPKSTWSTQYVEPDERTAF